MTIRVAFRVENPSGWMGGANYLLNICRVLRAHVPGVVPVLFVPPNGGEQLERRYAEAAGSELVVLPERSGISQKLAILGVDDRADMRLFAHHGIDLVFESAGYYGPRPALPVLSWLPDFQHHRLPNLFSRSQWWARDIRYRRILSTRRNVLLSSQSARADMERWHGRPRGSVHVVPFAVRLEHLASWDDGEQLRLARGLPSRFLFLPNQLWVHKNHRVVVEALGLLGESAPVVVVSGSPHDPRAPRLLEELQQRAVALSIEQKFHYVGQLPYRELLALNARADRLVNPSLSEGWSTTVEEARALGTPMLLSDIDVHREQAPPGTIFFNASDAAECARAIRAAMALPARAARPHASATPDAETAFAARLAQALAAAAQS